MGYLDDLAKLKELLDAGAITSSEYEHQKANILSANADAAAPGTDEARPGYYQQPGNPYCAPGYGYYPEQKSKLVAGLLGIFLGHLGIHNFYLGFRSNAIKQLVLSIIGYCTIIIGVGVVLLAIAGIWGFVEGVKVLVGSQKFLTDANGIPLKD
ncbi:MAG: NINE protein [Clostridiales Family XIII bacterium]|nr:NINE protein [Clostridiales Family XIII bacterium]